MDSPWYHFIIILPLADRRGIRGKWPLARKPDRSWWHRQTGLIFCFCSPWLHGQQDMVTCYINLFLCILNHINTMKHNSLSYKSFQSSYNKFTSKRPTISQLPCEMPIELIFYSLINLQDRREKIFKVLETLQRHERTRRYNFEVIYLHVSGTTQYILHVVTNMKKMLPIANPADSINLFIARKKLYTIN